MYYHEYTILVPGPFRERLISSLVAAGCLGVIEHDDTVTAYFPELSDANAIARDLELWQILVRQSGYSDFSFRHAVIPDKDWNESWKEGFRPLDVGQTFTILPPWEAPKAGRINLVIDPAMAFGTGHHETTRSCLVLLEKHAAGMTKERFLDVGTGTGILAIAAQKCGFRYVEAVDTDPLAVDAARRNAELNKTPGIIIREGSISAADGRFDCITANILSGVLVLLAPALARGLNPSGVLILSGILTGQDDEVLAAMEQEGLACRERYQDGKWTSLVVQNS